MTQPHSLDVTASDGISQRRPSTARASRSIHSQPGRSDAAARAVGHRPGAIVVADAAAFDEERSPAHLGAGHELGGSQALVPGVGAGERGVSLVEATEEVLEAPDVVTDRRRDGDVGGDDAVAMGCQAPVEDGACSAVTERDRNLGPLHVRGGPGALLGHREPGVPVCLEDLSATVEIARLGQALGPHHAERR